LTDAFLSEWNRIRDQTRMPEGKEGRGIVTCAGGVRLFTCVYVLARVLRETLKCPLPIQLWHFGGEEISPIMHHELTRLGVELVDMNLLLEDHPARITNGWQLKPYAILHSRFSEVLFLDADQVPTRNPEDLFEWPEYEETGAVFWPDIIDIKADNEIWAYAGLDGENVPSWESGQILVDKRRHWLALHAALLLNESDTDVYNMIYGDKDTFLIGWRLTNAPASVVSHRPYVDSRILIQRDFSGAPLFQHRTGAKWTYDDRQYEVEGIQHFEACLGFLDDLKQVWNGRLFFPPDRSAAARAEEDRLSTLGALRLEVLGDLTAEIELLPAHEFGVGRSADRQNWYVSDASGSLQLIIHDGSRVTYHLDKRGSGIWEGNYLTMTGGRVRIDERAVADPVEHVAANGSGIVGALVAASGIAAKGERAAEADRTELLSALCLMLRAEPGIRSEIEIEANKPGAIGKICRAVLDRVPGAIDRTPPKSLGTIGTGYTRMGQTRP